MIPMSLDLNVPSGQCQIQDTKKHQKHTKFVNYTDLETTQLITLCYTCILTTTEKVSILLQTQKQPELTHYELKLVFYSARFYIQEH